MDEMKYKPGDFLIDPKTNIVVEITGFWNRIYILRYCNGINNNITGSYRNQDAVERNLKYLGKGRALKVLYG